MNDTLQIKELAANQLSTAKANVEKQRERLLEAERTLEQLQAILEVFDDRKKRKSQSRKAKKAASQAKKSVSQAQMMKACLSLVHDNKTVPKADLLTLAIEKLRAEIVEDMKGASMRFNECMESKHFAINGDGMVSLPSVPIQGGQPGG